MITAIDTNILFDILLSDPKHVESSIALIEQASQEGVLIIGEAAYAELAAYFSTEQALNDFLSNTGIEFSPSSPNALFMAGRMFRDYRAAGGQRQRILADFLIGAHAIMHAERLLTRDRGYFPNLCMLE
jgi:hypothetical protein